VQRIRKRAGLVVPPKLKRIGQRGVSADLPQATHRHFVWSWDFIFGRTDNADPLEIKTLLHKQPPVFSEQDERQIRS
jgi:hypothetical protein